MYHNANLAMPVDENNEDGQEERGEKVKVRHRPI
jgi:hypothetical protein